MLSNHRRLASILAVTLPELQALARSGISYKESDRPKKTGGVRHVENPARPLKRIQKRIAKLLSRIAPPDFLFCPVKGRSYVNNAAQHKGRRTVRCLDVRKYFPNTPARRVHWFFRHVMKCERDVADTLTRLATYNEHLPTGSPLSPILAYYSYLDVWQAVAKFAAGKGFVLTVYIDDVAVSGDKVTAEDMWSIKRIIHAAGLRYHKEKHYVQSAPEITGVIVQDGILRVPNRQLKKLWEAKQKLTLASNSEERIYLTNLVRGLTGQIEQVRKVCLP